MVVGGRLLGRNEVYVWLFGCLFVKRPSTVMRLVGGGERRGPKL